MSLFTSSGTTYNRESFFALAKKQAQYAPLEALLGRPNVNTLLEIMFQEQYKNFNKGGGPVTPTSQFTVQSSFKGFLVEGVKDSLRLELERTNGKQNDVDELWSDALGGLLRGELKREMGPIQQHHKPAGMIDGRASEVSKAAQWTGSGNPALASIYKYVFVTPTIALGKDDSIVQEIFQSWGEAPAYRPPNLTDNTVKYPSSVGGRFLLRKIFEKVANQSWPAKGDARWADFALFFLGAIVQVQGLPDYNKRTARVAYAIVMVNSGLGFQAPSMNLIKQVTKM